MQIDGETVAIFGGFQNHCRWWLQPWNKKTLTPWRKVMTNLDSILKSRDITLPTKVHLVKAMVFPVVMYGCESWTMKKAEPRRIDAFELWYWRRLLRVLWTERTQPIHPKGNQSWMFFGRADAEAETPIPDAKSWLIWKTLMLGKIEGRRRRGRQRWDGWMASLTQWTWVWVRSQSWW